MAGIVLLLPLDGSPQLEEWLAEDGVVSGERRGRPPTVAEVRDAVRHLGPAAVEEAVRGTRWQIDVLFGPVAERPSGAPTYAGGFELSAEIGDLDEQAPATELSVRGGDFEVVMKLARRLVAAAGPLVAVSASEGEPIMIG